MISMRNWEYHSRELVKRIGNIALWTSPLGKVFSGTSENLRFLGVETLYLKSAMLVTRTARIHSMVMKTQLREESLKVSMEKQFLDLLKDESIRVDSNPRCGSCLCGKCALGSKPISLENE